MLTIKAALLDAPAASGKAMFVRIDELLEEAALTDRHLPQITDCDLPAGRYVWIPAEADAENPFGGEFVDKDVLAQRNAPDFEVAFYDLCEAVQGSGIGVPPTTRAYLDYQAERRKRLALRNKKNKGDA